MQSAINPKSGATKTVNNFTVTHTHYSVTKFSLHITSALVVILQHLILGENIFA